MKTKEQIKHEYEQNHYRKQRELIDDGKLDYWGLSAENQKGIVGQCKAEAERYPKLEWLIFSQEDSAEDGTSSNNNYWGFNNSNLYYRRVDPLPVKAFTEEIEKYKEGLTRCANDKLRLEKDLSRQKNLAKVATERVEELVRENKALDKTIEGFRMECSDLHEQVMDYLKDFHELAMRR